MELELNHLGQTLAVGGFAVYAILILVRVCRAKWVPRFFDATEGGLQLQHTAVYLALVLAAGVVLEDVSKSYSAKRASFLPEFFDCVLGTDNELRLRSLFKVAEFREDSIDAQPKNIARELLEWSPGSAAVRGYFQTVRGAIAGDPPRLTVSGEDNVRSMLLAIDGIFYDAKNRVYQEETYFRELSDVSDRVEFTRSLMFLCLVFSVVYFAFGVIGFIPPIAAFLDINKSERFGILCLAVLYVAGGWLVGIAYQSEASNYDLRVFGYYTSLASYPESAPGPTIP